MFSHLQIFLILFNFFFTALCSFLNNQKTFQAITSHLQLWPTINNHLRLFPGSNLSKQCPSISNNFQTLPSFSSNFQPFPAISSLFQPLPACNCKPFLAISNHVQPFTVTFVFQQLFAGIKLLLVLWLHQISLPYSKTANPIKKKLPSTLGT